MRVEALRAYDAATARRKGAQLTSSDLNLPEEHALVGDANKGR